MKTLLSVTLIILCTGLPLLYAQTSSNNADLAACFELEGKPNTFCERVKLTFIKEFEGLNEEGQLGISILDNIPDNCCLEKDISNSRFYTLIRLEPGQWMINRRLKVPFLFNIYQNNYCLGATVKLYRRGVAEPIMVESYKMVGRGPKDFQILRNDSHDGSMILSAGERIVLEKDTERKLSRKMSQEIYNKMRDYGG